MIEKPLPMEHPEMLAMARRLLDEGRSWDEVLVALRPFSLTPIASIKVLREIRGISLREAKAVVHNSAAWADRREEHNRLHDQLVAAYLSEFGSELSIDLTRPDEATPSFHELARYGHLRYFRGCYFYESYDVSAPLHAWESVVDRFAGAEQREVVAGAAADITLVLEAVTDDGRLASLLDRFGCCFAYESVPISERAWITAVRDRLVAKIASRVDR